MGKYESGEEGVFLHVTIRDRTTKTIERSFMHLSCIKSVSSIKFKSSSNECNCNRYSFVDHESSPPYDQGDSAWDLCDSKNIPLEILSDLAAEKNLVVDIRAFEEKLEEHKGRR